MDANLQFWPKIGDRVSYSGAVLGEKGKTSQFSVKEIKEEYPCTYYIIEDIKTHKQIRAFRPELSKANVFDEISTVNYAPEFDLVEVQVPSFDWNEILAPWVESIEPRPSTSVDIQGQQLQETNILDLNEAQLDKIQSEMKPKTTIKTENWAINRFNEWQLQRGLSIDLATVDPTELAKDLRKFYAEVRTKDGNMMSPSGLRGLRAALHRTLTCPPIARDINILSDREFVLANKMFEAMCRQYVQNANPKPKHHPAIEKGDLNKIAQYINLYKTCPEILLHCFWFLLCYNFARRGGEGWRQLTRQSFQVGIDDQGKQYLYLSHTERNKNWQGGSSSKAWDYSDTRAYGINIEGVHLNIVEVFNFYISKLHPECSALLQKPKYKKWSKAEHSVWFDNVPLGVNKINETMKRISECAHLSMTYTNHSVRATAITVMYQGGVDTKQICKITKHKTEESLKHYIDGQSAEQKRRCSEVLSLAFQDPKDNNSSTSNNKSLPLPTISSVNNCTTDRPILSQSANTSTQVYNSTQSLAFPFQRPQSFNFNVNGGTCHFHFHYDSAKPAATSDQL